MSLTALKSKEEGEMLYRGLPGRRLITQNLFSSAAVFEREKHPTWLSIQDLSTLIDLFCLYDQVIVIGRGMRFPFRKLRSDLLDLLENSQFVVVDDPEAEDVENITKTAQMHLAAFLGESEVGRYEGLLRYALSPHEARYGLRYIPDGVEAIHLGTK